MADVRWPESPVHTNDDRFCTLCGEPETTFTVLHWSTDHALWACGRCLDRQRYREAKRVR